VWWNGCIDPHFLDLGTSWRGVVSFTPLPLNPGGSPPCTLDRRLDGPQNRSGRRGEEKILDRTRTRTPTPRSSSQSLYRLRYPGSSPNINIILNIIFLSWILYFDRKFVSKFSSCLPKRFKCKFVRKFSSCLKTSHSNPQDWFPVSLSEKSRRMNAVGVHPLHLRINSR
jgi:hypothetical protein